MNNNSMYYVDKEGTLDGWDMPQTIGWYFYGEDDATSYGPYKTKELCEQALIRFADDLNSQGCPK